MPTNEIKRQIFMKLRAENYRASLRLEGMVQRPKVAGKPAIIAVATTATTFKAKHGR